MIPFQAPTEEMNFLLRQVFDAAAVWQGLPAIAELLDLDTATAILEEGAKFCAEQIQPLNQPGDTQGVSFNGSSVKTPDGYAAVFRQYAEGGWVGLCGEPEYGGMGMPKMLGVLLDEMGYSASNAFTLYAALTAGAALCIHAHGSEALKALYLPKLYSGEWAGAMDMTEPQSGSDLRTIATRAVPQSDGSYRISGSKMFITGGDHDLTSNVIHLVLAKIQGSDGISLFLVPKFKVTADGEIGDANGVTVGAVEHKMGLKGSATCVMNYDDAEGYLIGRANRGLVCMFTMMNYERLSIGIQGLGSAQMAYQLSASYAKERLQGLAAGGSPTGAKADPIIVHGDVRRMLLNIRALTDAGRALAVMTGMQLDKAKYAADSEEQQQATRFAALLTPVAKAFLSDRGFDACVTAQQVFGGHGYIGETGIEQLVRDTRIAQIYEGTNGIQAIDFLGRKLVGDNLATVTEFFSWLQQQQSCDEVFASQKQQLQQLQQRFVDVIAAVNQQKHDQPALINAVAVDALDAFGYLLYGHFWLMMADKSLKAAAQLPVAFVQRKQQLMQYYFAKLLPRVSLHLDVVTAGDETIMQLSADDF
ncbi:acyl-CoA dehydrogenase C-terminal domain-containing protein [Shewanella sp. A32]|uniref:acyl-CoA dehydrogenase C-terminal domain-containing protein n=1 Tax=Shewanella sp. A32 TaxID=3031327 RepID=UPI0023B9F9B9|nr:acyl-CoA dehydrogenase C-terminal domain-containing protein [Shewanella sp. A32]MDF0534366.1 acyl-CoA dehydrogenase C-terminal domain-containing protein [Shewanella sp. A32]